MRSSFPTAEVLIEVSKLAGNSVYVLGEVNAPGVVTIQTPATVSQVIAMAGGHKETAGLPTVVLIRMSSENKPVGKLIDIESVFGGRKSWKR